MLPFSTSKNFFKIALLIDFLVLPFEIEGLNASNFSKKCGKGSYAIKTNGKTGFRHASVSF